MLSEAVVRLAAFAAGFAVVTGVWAWMPRGPRRQHGRRPPTDAGTARGLTGAAGVLAVVVSGPALVGDGTLDAAWRAVFAVALGLVGAFAPVPVLAGAFAVLAVGLRGTTEGGIAAGAAGLLVALVVCRVALPQAVSVVASLGLGLLAAQPDAHGGTQTYAVPVAAVALLLVGTLVRLRQPQRRWAWTLAAGFTVAVGAASGLGGLGALRARSTFDAGLNSARAALAHLRAGNVTLAQQELDAARAELAAGRRSLRAWWAQPARAVPVVGVNIRAVDRAVSAGIRLGEAGSQVVSSAQVKQLRVAGGRAPIEAMKGIDAPLSKALGALTDSVATLSTLRSRWLVGPISSKLADFRVRIDNAERSAVTALDAERLAVAMLGGNGPPRRYFVAFTTPVELRGSAGFIGNYGELVVDNGSISLTRFGRLEDLQAKEPKTPDGLGWDPEFVSVYHAQLSGSLWQNLTISPDFPTAADAMERLYPISGGEQVDGVLAVDPQAMSALLAIEGPISVPTWPQPLSAQTIVPVLEHDEYNAFPNTSDRARFLSQLTTAVITRFKQANLTDVAGVLNAFGPAVTGKHLLLASRVGDEEAAIRHLGIAGDIPPLNGDALAVITTNANPSKIDWYLHRSIDESVSLDPGKRRIDASLTIRLQNSAPTSGEAPEVAGGQGGPPGTNRLLLFLLTPLTIRRADVDGTPVQFAQTRLLGRGLWGIEISIPAGETKLVHVELGGNVVTNPYRLLVTEQATPVPDAFHLSVSRSGVPVLDRSVALLKDQTFTVMP